MKLIHAHKKTKKKKIYFNTLHGLAEFHHPHVPINDNSTSTKVKKLSRPGNFTLNPSKCYKSRAE